MWISVGIDLDSNYTVSVAAQYTADGGYALSNSIGGVDVGGSGQGRNSTVIGNGTTLTGSPPNGTTMTMGGAAPPDSGNGTAATGVQSVSDSTSATSTTTSSATSSLTTYTGAGSHKQVIRPGLTVLAALIVVVISL